MDLFKLVGSIFIDTDEANNSLSKTDKKADSLGDKFGSLAKGAAKVGTAVIGGATAVVSSVTAMASSTASEMDVIDKASQRMKIGAESYQELAHAASLSGVEMSALEKAAKKLEGTDLNMDQALEEIYSLGTAEERATKAAELFGDSVAYQLTPMLNASGEEFAAMRQEANDLGLVFDEDAVKAGATLNDALSNVKDAAGALMTSLGTALIPVVQTFAELILGFLPQIRAIFDRMAPILINLFQTLMPLLMSLAEKVLPIVASLLEVLLPVFVKIAEVVLPILIKGLELTVTAFNKLFTAAKNIFEKLIPIVKGPINTILGFINGLIRGVVGGVNGIIKALNKLNIKVPGWVTTLTGVSSFGFNLPEVNAPQIPLLANGGDIASQGAAIVGEQGAELVQLNRGARVTPLKEGIEEKLDILTEAVREISENMAHLGLYINGGVMAGYLAPDIDQALGKIAARRV